LNQEQAIVDFFSAVARLRDLGVIRSNKHIADIAEFVCCNFLGMELVASGNHPGYDGVIDGETCQVKFSGGKSNTIDLGDPAGYDRLIIVLGPDSNLRPTGKSERWLIYSIPSAVVDQCKPHGDGMRRYSKGQIPQQHFVGGFNALDALAQALT